MSRYALDDVNTDEKKQDAFRNGLNDEIQFQLFNTDYATPTFYKNNILSTQECI
jgi:hypothetical protein